MQNQICQISVCLFMPIANQRGPFYACCLPVQIVRVAQVLTMAGVRRLVFAFTLYIIAPLKLPRFERTFRDAEASTTIYAIAVE